MRSLDVNIGSLLLADPFLADVNFKRGVILLCDHRTDGSVGFILNRPLKMQVNQLVADFPEFVSEVYYGGPVATDTIHYIHNVGSLLDNSIKVDDGVYWGGDFDKLKFLIESELIKPSNIRFFVGYSGWSEGQLKEELKYGSWFTAHMHPNYLFKSKASRLWKQVMHDKGQNFTVVAQMPDPICLN